MVRRCNVEFTCDKCRKRQSVDADWSRPAVLPAAWFEHAGQCFCSLRCLVETFSTVKLDLDGTEERRHEKDIAANNLEWLALYQREPALYTAARAAIKAWMDEAAGLKESQ